MYSIRGVTALGYTAVVPRNQNSRYHGNTESRGSKGDFLWINGSQEPAKESQRHAPWIWCWSLKCKT
jgi:hypothetical protein